MLLTTRPSEITTHEQNIAWSISQLIQAQATATTLPPKVIEAEGYFPSDIIAVTPIRTVDGGYRHVMRVLMPVNPAFYGASIPVWRFVGDIITP